MGKGWPDQRPRYGAGRQAGQVWPDDRPYEGRVTDLGPRGLRLLQWCDRVAALSQQEVRREQMVAAKVPRRSELGGAALPGRHELRLLPCQLQPSEATAKSEQPDVGEQQSLFP